MEQRINVNPDEIQNIIISTNTPQTIKLKNLSLDTIDIEQDKNQSININEDKNQTIYIDKNGTGYNVTDVIVNGISAVVDGIAYIKVPLQTSDLINDSNFVSLNELSQVSFTGNYNDLKNKPYIPEVPTKTSELTNDSGFITNTANDLTNYTLTSDFSSVAFTGDYDDLIDTPTIPTSMSDLMNDMGYITKDVDDLTYYTESRYYSEVATTGNYNDLFNKPTIPTTTSELTNDSGFITDSYHDSTKQDTLVSGTNIKTINNNSLLGSGNITISGGGSATDVQINGTSITSSGTANILTNGTYSSTNKIATMSDIPSVPTKTSDLTNDSGFITNTVNDLTNYTLSSALSTVATSGSYTDLSNKPSIPTKTSDLTNDSGYITNTVNNLTNYTLSSNLSTVATSGSYTDLSNKPSIPTKTSDLTNDSGFITNTVNDLTNYTLSSNLSTVATSGSYTDLSNKPSIPTKTSDLTNDSGYITNNYEIYSNTETRIGTWIDGKPIYRKVVPFTVDTTANLKDIDLGISNLKYVIKCTGSLISGNSVRLIPQFYYNNGNLDNQFTIVIYSVYTDTGKARLLYGNWLKSYANATNCNLFIEYTKTTD